MKIFRIKKYNFEKEKQRISSDFQDYNEIWRDKLRGQFCPSSYLNCITIYQSLTLGLTWKHLVSYTINGCDEKEFYKRQEEYYKEAQKEVKKLYKTENCSHKNTHFETVCHPGGEVGKGLICDNCDKLLKYE